MDLRCLALVALPLGTCACIRPGPLVRCAAAPEPLASNTNQMPFPVAQAAYGQLDPNLLARVQSIALVDHVKLGVASDGRIGELSIYHNDSAPIPRAVRDALNQEFPHHHVITYESEWENTALTEATVRLPNGRICEMSATNAGNVRYIECLVNPDDVPTAVQQTLQRLLPTGKVEEAELREDGTGRHYKIMVRQGSQIHQVQCAPDGALSAHYLRIPAILLVAQ